MTGKELYEKYKGMKAESNERVGIICGYDNDEGGIDLIMAISDDCPFQGWESLDQGDVIETNINNRHGYFYVEEQHIID